MFPCFVLLRGDMFICCGEKWLHSASIGSANATDATVMSYLGGVAMHSVDILFIGSAAYQQEFVRIWD